MQRARKNLLLGTVCGLTECRWIGIGGRHGGPWTPGTVVACCLLPVEPVEDLQNQIIDRNRNYSEVSKRL